MQAANNGVNAIRTASGQAAQYASQDIVNMAAASKKTGGSSRSTSTPTTYAQAAGTTTYIDPVTNIKKTGYYDAGGKTYTDSALTTRVPVGSIMDTAAGQYTMTENGGVKYTEPTYASVISQQDPLTGFEKKLETWYADILQNQRAATNAATQRASTASRRRRMT